jgi:hypothetical protein
MAFMAGWGCELIMMFPVMGMLDGQEQMLLFCNFKNQG